MKIKKKFKVGLDATCITDRPSGAKQRFKNLGAAAGVQQEDQKEADATANITKKGAQGGRLPLRCRRLGFLRVSTCECSSKHL